MKEMMTTKEGEEQQTEKKEQIIQIVLSWRKSLTPFYQTFNPLLSKFYSFLLSFFHSFLFGLTCCKNRAIEEFLDSLESTPFGSTLVLFFLLFFLFFFLCLYFKYLKHTIFLLDWINFWIRTSLSPEILSS